MGTPHSKPCRSFQQQLRQGRRQILQAGFLGLGAAGLGAGGFPFGGLGLPELLAAEPSRVRTGGGFGKAKRCIFLFMWGGPSQLDTFDLKPHAPAEIRGEFQPISTRTPGLQICEHFERLASLSDKYAIVRSFNHDDPAHLSSGHTTLTGHLPPVNKSDAEPPSDRDTPHFGCVMSRLRPAPPVLPSFVTLPWKVSHPAAPGGQAPGQHGGWLGRQYDPFVVAGNPSQPDWRVPSLSLADGISVERLGARRHLLQQLDRVRKDLDDAGIEQASHLQSRSFELLASNQVRQAFDLTCESPKTRERYGNNLHGQCVLLARRLVEHGVPIVTVNWHNDGKNFWDTHGDNFNRLKNDLIPVADRALSALLTDLDERNLLDETLVVWVGEFGRKPTITTGNAGREHWPHCYSGLLAGGGIQGGAVYGSSDHFAAHPATRPASPHDLMATVYHCLGVPSHASLPDVEDRPRPVYGGTPLPLT